MEYSDDEKLVYALLLAVGLVFVFCKAAYEHFMGEKFTLFHVFHPIEDINAKERQFISNFLIPFHFFSAKQKRQFLKRFAWFKSKKPFVFYGDVKEEEKIKAYVTASAVLVTMGMRNFKFQKSISRIIVYPSTYYSNIKKRHHIGEYNPKLKTLVFSAEDLKEGYRIPNDNKNLGIHEVAHALMIENRNNSSWESRKFRVGLARLKMLYDSYGFKEKLSNSDYLREYSQTNFFEFFAVLLETFFESPEKLKDKFPQVHHYIQRMLNYPVF